MQRGIDVTTDDRVLLISSCKRSNVTCKVFVLGVAGFFEGKILVNRKQRLWLCGHALPHSDETFAVRSSVPQRTTPVQQWFRALGRGRNADVSTVRKLAILEQWFQLAGQGPSRYSIPDPQLSIVGR